MAYFSFWNIFFVIRDIDILYYATLGKEKEYLWKYWSGVLHTWHQKWKSQRETKTGTLIFNL